MTNTVAAWASKSTAVASDHLVTAIRLQISLDTRDVFIECTATDLTKAKIVLNTVVSMFSEYCQVPFEVEPVEVIDSFGESHGELEAVL